MGTVPFTIWYQLNSGNGWKKPLEARVHEESDHKINEVQTRLNGKTLRQTSQGRHRNGRGLNSIRFPTEREIKVMNFRQDFCTYENNRSN